MSINSAHLPGELIDIIIKCLLPDRRAVKTCSLICRAWVPWTRLHLFYRIRLYKSTFYEFLHLLRSPHCTFPPYVHDIQFNWQLAEIRSSDHHLLLDVLNGQHAWIPGHNGVIKHSFFHNARVSAMKAISGNTSSHIFNMVRLFPAVENLGLFLYGFQEKVTECNWLPPVSPALTSLVVVCNSPEPRSPALPHEWENFLKWIYREGICGIRKLYLGLGSSWDMEGIQALLKTQGSALRHLHAIPYLGESAVYVPMPMT
jgi:hypothetical protein